MTKSRASVTRGVHLAALPVAALAVAAGAGAILGFHPWSEPSSLRSDAPAATSMAPACAPPSVADIDGRGDDATWRAALGDQAAVARSLTVDSAGATIRSVEVVVGDASAISDPQALAAGSRDVVARATAQTVSTASDATTMATDLTVKATSIGQQPVFVLIEYADSEECSGGAPDAGTGLVADPVGQLVVTAG